MVTADAPAPVYTAEDVAGGIDISSTENNLEDTERNWQHPLRLEVQKPITQYPERLLSNAAVFATVRQKPTKKDSQAALRTASEPSPKDATSHTARVQAEQQQRLVGKEIDERQAHIIESFHDAVRGWHIEVVARLVSSGVVSPDVTNDIGTTPLIAAVRAGNATMVRCLVQLGAQVNALAAYDDDDDETSNDLTTSATLAPQEFQSEEARRETRRSKLYARQRSGRTYPLRTALQVAAYRGNLVIVKLLMAECGADDAIIAPDGQHALRLAATAGHREVVSYLPSRRGGELRRWKASHAVALRNIRKAGKNIGKFLWVLLWEIPEFFVWTCPKHIVVLPMVRTSKFCWHHKGRFPEWCGQQVRKMPEHARLLGEVCKDLERGTIKAARRIPEFTRDLAALTWRFIKRIPPAARIAALWVLNSLKAAGLGAVRIAARFFSLVHTALLSLATMFRNVTPRDVLDGFVAVLRAIFVDLPRILYDRVVVGGMRAVYDVLATLFGLFGKCLYWIGYALLSVVVWVGKQVGSVFLWTGRSVKKGVDEVLVWIDPKR
ncbi:ankyrin repeat domain-containing protein 50 [Microdochium nivale]|nr:ankyrin repeat domain-containing protein 50 [Microdochium nivale]